MTHRRTHIHVPRDFGQRAADATARSMGSWRFIVIQTAIVAAWMTANAIGFLRHWDPYPFILLNLLFSTQAAYAAPIIMMSQNRQAERDRLRDDTEAQEVEEMAALTKEIHRLTLEQNTILALLHAHMAESRLAE